MSLIGKKFPSITVNATDKSGKSFQLNVLDAVLSEKKKAIVFWYPKNFTSVCSSEMHAFEEAYDEFIERNTLVFGASCYSVEQHSEWLSANRDNGGISGVQFPILSDTDRELAMALDILDNSSESHEVQKSSGVTYRATYLIDETGTVFHESVNHMPVGRNIAEFIRLIDAWTHVNTHGEACLANWKVD